MAVSRLASTPPRLYKVVGISSRGLSGGVSRHWPPVPARLKRLMHNFPSFPYEGKVEDAEGDEAVVGCQSADKMPAFVQKYLQEDGEQQNQYG